MSNRESILRRLLLLCGTEPSPKRTRRIDPQLDTLEGRVVLSRFGFPGQAFDASTISGETTGMASRPHRDLRGFASPRGGPSAPVQDDQLQADIATLRTNLDAVLSGSMVTEAQRKALSQDLRSLAKLGVRVNPETLAPVTERLLASLADGSHDADPAVALAIHDAFTVLFADTDADASVIEQTYTDYLSVSRSLNISTEDLTTLAADRAAIQADLERLGMSTTDTTTPNPNPPQASHIDLIFSPGLGRPRMRKF